MNYKNVFPIVALISNELRFNFFFNKEDIHCLDLYIKGYNVDLISKYIIELFLIDVSSYHFTYSKNHALFMRRVMLFFFMMKMVQDYMIMNMIFMMSGVFN